jgi:hypothetical protein
VPADGKRDFERIAGRYIQKDSTRTTEGTYPELTACLEFSVSCRAENNAANSQNVHKEGNINREVQARYLLDSLNSIPDTSRCIPPCSAPGVGLELAEHIMVAEISFFSIKQPERVAECSPCSAHSLEIRRLSHPGICLFVDTRIIFQRWNI